METQTGVKLSCEVIESLQSLAELVSKMGASINEVLNAADTLRQKFLEFYSEESLKAIKHTKP